MNKPQMDMVYRACEKLDNAQAWMDEVKLTANRDSDPDQAALLINALKHASQSAYDGIVVVNTLLGMLKGE